MAELARLMHAVNPRLRELHDIYGVILDSYPCTIKVILTRDTQLEVASGNELVEIDHLTLSLDIDGRVYLGYHNVLPVDEIEELAEAEVQAAINQASGRGENLNEVDIALLRHEMQTHYRENDTLVHVTDRPQQSWVCNQEGLEAGIAAIAAILEQC